MESRTEMLPANDDTQLALNPHAILEDQGYGVAVVRDGEVARDLPQEKVFDLVLVDLKFPDLSGNGLGQ